MAFHGLFAHGSIVISRQWIGASAQQDQGNAIIICGQNWRGAVFRARLWVSAVVQKKLRKLWGFAAHQDSPPKVVTSLQRNASLMSSLAISNFLSGAASQVESLYRRAVRAVPFSPKPRGSAPALTSALASAGLQSTD